MKKRLRLIIFICAFTVLTVGNYGWAADQITDDSTASTVLASVSSVALVEDNVISMARANWDTGWFQAEIFRQLFEALGYVVIGPQTMENQDFFLAAARGDIDLWTNSWFPSHRSYLKDDRVQGKVEPIGFLVKAGALQGYLIDKQSAENFDITNLIDFRNPEIAQIFDRDGNGKAELIGCNPGWGVCKEIEHHLTAYGLNDTVEHIKGDYSPMMAEMIKKHKWGAPVFFYTWTPNWTIGTLVPGRDVIWLQVPFPSLPEEQKEAEGRIMVKNIPGCGADPCAMGFPPSDIRVVANKHFLARNPAVRRLAENVTISLDDINAQNARMIAGEDDDEDIRRHAAEWIHQNRTRVDQWLKMARAELTTEKKPSKPVHIAEKKEKILRVATKRLAPFVMYKNRRYTGFSVELWEKIAHEMGSKYELYGVNTIAKLLDEVKRNTADVAIGGIGITSWRERDLDFSHAFFESGYQIMVPEEQKTLLGTIFVKVFSILFSPGLLYGAGIFFIVLIIAAHIIWLLERRHNPEFSESYLNGLWQSVWWAVVTVTTVGYGDKTPKRRTGRLFALIWILAGYFVFAYFTASVTTTITLQELKGDINGPEDLFGKQVATVAKSPASEYLAGQGITTLNYKDIDRAYEVLTAKEVDALVYDAPVLQHYATKEGKGKVKVVGLTFQKQQYGIAVPINSPYRERINMALLRLIETGVYKEIHDKWFGP
jgi:ABC-type proline/glycine betaine transport system substrate-binding protein/ABC-type amino acid transport substrate-binding protein